MLEALLSMAAVAGALFLPALAIFAQLCAFGECSEPSRDDIRLSHGVAVAVALAVVGSLVLAALRGARWAWLWHLLVAAVAAVSVVGFTLGVDWTPDPAPVPRSPDYVPCYSGSGDCPGG